MSDSGSKRSGAGPSSVDPLARTEFAAPALPSTAASLPADPRAAVALPVRPAPAPAPVPRRRARGLWRHAVALVAGAGIALALAFALHAYRGRATARATAPAASPLPSSIVASDGGMLSNPRPVTASHLLDLEHEAIASSDKELGALLSNDVFAVGPGADDAAAFGGPVVAMIRRAVGDVPPGGLRVRGDDVLVQQYEGVAWISEQITIEGDGGATRTFVATQAAFESEGRWLVAAYDLAIAVPRSAAVSSSARGLAKLPEKTGLRTPALRGEIQAALASRDQLIASFSERTDVVFCDADGARTIGFDAVRGALGAIAPDIRIDGPIHAFDATSHGGWGIANVTLGVQVDGEMVRVHYRAFLVLLKQDLRWRVVQLQLSSGQ